MTDLVVTDADRAAARAAIVEGWHNCKMTNTIGKMGKPCDCDFSAVAGCEVKVESIARAIATARTG